ncbi:MAG: helix-turn-helix domain-containing protein [Blautia producta]|nr:helix-turn-helix transcriptional regulator [uncultured Blautia sp.]
MKKYTNFEEMFQDEDYVSPEEREQINFQVELIGKIIAAREEKGLSQRDLAELSGIKQPAIARMESMKTIPKIDTLFKVLAPLGYTLSITPCTKS